MNSKFGGITSIILPKKLWNQNFTNCAIDIFRKDMKNLPYGYRFLCISSAERFSFKILSLKQDRKTPLEGPEPKYEKRKKKCSLVKYVSIFLGLFISFFCVYNDQIRNVSFLNVWAASWYAFIVFRPQIRPAPPMELTPEAQTE